MPLSKPALSLREMLRTITTLTPVRLDLQSESEVDRLRARGSESQGF